MCEEELKSIELRLHSFLAVSAALIIVNIASVVFNICSLPGFSIVPMFERHPYWRNPLLVDFWIAVIGSVAGISIMITTVIASRSIPETIEKPQHHLLKTAGLTATANSAALLIANFVYSAASGYIGIASDLVRDNIFHIVMLLFGLGLAAASLGFDEGE